MDGAGAGAGVQHSAAGVADDFSSQQLQQPPKKKTSRRRTGASSPKRRCVSTACIACRKRKSKCDGAVPSCAACASVYGTECIYDPNSDHRRKGVYKDKVDSMKARNSTLQILIEAILNASEDEAFTIVKKIRTCDSLDNVAEQILKQEYEQEDAPSEESDDGFGTGLEVEGERDLARKMGELRVENGSVRFIGGTSHLIYLADPQGNINEEPHLEDYTPGTDPVTTWTRVTDDPQLITHLMDKYFNYHYPYFTTLSRKMFERDYLKGRAGLSHSGTVYCSSLLVNAMLALGCHFSDVPGAFGAPGDSRTKGDHFFAEAKRIIIENGEYEKPRLVTVQALALMSVREAGCAREAKGWVYSGMSFRMAQDIGLNLEIGGPEAEQLTEHEIDARRITFWGCFLFDKCWSNYLGRLPLLPKNSYNVSKFEVFPDEDAQAWSPLPDSGFDESSAQPSRTRAVALELSKLCEISSDLLIFFYHPNHIGRSSGKAVELKKLSELHRRLEEWRKELPKEFEPKEGQLPNVILMHMFFHLQYIHLFRPFLKYAPSTSPLPGHVSPRRICTANAGAISKLMRLYKKTWNLRQICNIAVYMIHSACTIHLLNLPEKTARRDIIHGVKHLEEIAEDWLCARRTLCILSVLARKWRCELPEEAAFVLQRTDEKFGYYSTSDVPSPRSSQSGTSPSLSDKAMAAKSQGKDLSPLSQYTQAHMAQQASMENIPMNLPSMDAAMSQQTPPPPLNVDFSPPSWPQQQPHSTTSVPQYPSFLTRSSFSPEQQQQQQQHPQQPRVSPGGGGVNIDSPDWFMSDSVRWQQGFESWGDAASGGQVFVFGDGRTGSVDDGRQRRQDGTPDSSVGAGAPGGGGGFEGLSGGGWLPGLD